MEHLSDIKSKLLSSDSINSLIIESTVFKSFEKKGWQTEHSPYFLDHNTKKTRELDIKARKFFKNGDYSCDVNLIVECKNLKNYHIIANNKSSQMTSFDFIWMGTYLTNEFNKFDELLIKHNFSIDEAIYIKGKLQDYCVVDSYYKWNDYNISPFDIPKYNSYRETNINTVKDIDNSVIWKCIMGLQSAIDAYEQLLLTNIEYCINENVNREYSRFKKVELLIKDLIFQSNHIYYIHPIIVVKSDLWEFSDDQSLNELKFFRLNIQHFFTTGFWVDIVNFDHLEEYLQKSNKYINFHKNLKFQTY